MGGKKEYIQMFGRSPSINSNYNLSCHPSQIDDRLVTDAQDNNLR